jgi:hypothetical protein
MAGGAGVAVARRTPASMAFAAEFRSHGRRPPREADGLGMSNFPRVVVKRRALTQGLLTSLRTKAEDWTMTPDPKKPLVALVSAGEPAVKSAADQLSAEQRTILLRVLLDNIGEERVREAVQGLPPGDATRLFEGTVRGLLASRANDKDSPEKRLTNALASLDEGHGQRMLEALSQRKPTRLLSAAAQILKADRRLAMQDFGLETEDVLKRVTATDISVQP